MPGSIKVLRGAILLALLAFPALAAAQVTIQFTAASAQGSESVTSVQIPVTASGLSIFGFPSATVNYSVTGGTATSGTDYTLASGQLGFSFIIPTQVINLTISDDSLNEPTESIVITLSSPSVGILGAPSQFTYAILDDDPPPTVQFGQANPAGPEGASPAAIPVSLSAASGRQVSVQFTTVDGVGTAQRGVDYTPTSGTLTFAPGTTVQPILMQVFNNALFEPDKTVGFALSNPVNAGLGSPSSATYTILNDDPPPMVSFLQPLQSGPESQTTLSLPVVLSEPSGEDTIVNYVPMPGTASDGLDYLITPLPITIPAGQTVALIDATVVNDSINEPDETFGIQLLPPANGALGRFSNLTYTIADDDPPPVASFKAAQVSVNEDASTATVTVQLTGNESGFPVLSVDYITTVTDSGTGGATEDATAGQDYRTTSGTLTFDAVGGERTIQIPIIDDNIPEPPETFQVRLLNPLNVALQTSTVCTVTIYDQGPEVTTPTTHAILDYLIGKSTDATGLDTNLDGVIDVADVFYNIRFAQPEEPHNPRPADGDAATSLGAHLNWADSARVVTYDLYLWIAGADEPTSPTAAGLIASNFTPTLAYGTTYLWRVAAHNAIGTTRGPMWTFTTQVAPPAAPAGPAPADAAASVAVGTALDWADAARAVAYDIYLWKSSDAKPGTPTVTALNGSVYHPPANLEYSTAYNWQVVARNSTASTPGPVWTFTTQVAPPDAPASPTPPDGAANIVPNMTLSCAPSARATSYDLIVWTDGTTTPTVPNVVGQSSPSFPGAGGPSYSTAYHWQVIARNGAGSAAGPIWSFTTEVAPPDVPAAPSPADMATSVTATALLDWADAPRATSYDLYLWKEGDAQPGTPTAPALAVSQYQPAPLQLNTTYHWQVFAKNGTGNTMGFIWTFTTLLPAPDPPASPSPADNATDVLTTTNLDWADSAFAASYDLYLWADPAPKPSTPTAGGLASSNDTPSVALSFGATYHWQVVARNVNGDTPGPVWAFTTPPPVPDIPSAPSPADNATSVSFNTQLDWADTPRATSYDLYLWKTTDSQPDTPTTSGLTLSQFQPAPLSYDTAYHWQVVAKNAQGSTPGPVWTLTVYSQPVTIVDISPTSVAWVHGDMKFVHWKTTPAFAGASVTIQLFLSGSKVADLGADSDASGEHTFNFTMPTLPFNLFYTLRVTSVSDPALFVDSAFITAL